MNTRAATIATTEQPNDLRNQVLTCGLFPPKQHAAVDGDTVTGPTESTDARTGNTRTGTTSQAISLPKHSTHLGLINRFSAWKTWLDHESGGKLDHDQAVQLLKDFEPIEQFIAYLRTRCE